MIEDWGFEENRAVFALARDVLCSCLVTPDDLKNRLTEFGAAVVKFCRVLRERPGAQNIANQLSDASTSIGSNYRAACRARSRREFIAKLGVAIEEADETIGWLELLVKSEVASESELWMLSKEADELLRILASSRRTAAGTQSRSRS